MDTYLTISEAARIAQVTENMLIELVQSGKLKASKLSGSGRILVNEEDIMNHLPRKEREEYKKFAHLAGNGISMRQGSIQYGIPHQTISRWVERGYIKVVGQEGRAVLVDEADVAYCAEIYKQNPGQGKWIFSPGGKPYSKKAIKG